MSKIQKALSRIQAAGASTKPKPAAKKWKFEKPASSETVQVAQLVERDFDDDSDLSFSTNDKTLAVDQQVLRDEGLIAPDYHVNLLANQYRKIKRPLIGHAFGKRATKIENGNLIMVTSALSGEGKTFTAINLALSMAQERDHSVILVDADVAKPHVSDIFGVREEDGLLDLLEDDRTDVNSLIMPTDVDSLYVLPAGRPRPHSTELLASSRMDDVSELLGTITSEPIIIFDSPPLLQTSEAAVVASIVGQVVMIVRADHTSQDAVKSALSQLSDEQAVNLVLNQVRDGADDTQYGYGYGYGYGFGSDRNKSPGSEGDTGNNSDDQDRREKFDD